MGGGVIVHVCDSMLFKQLSFAVLIKLRTGHASCVMHNAVMRHATLYSMSHKYILYVHRNDLFRGCTVCHTQVDDFYCAFVCVISTTQYDVLEYDILRVQCTRTVRCIHTVALGTIQG